MPTPQSKPCAGISWRCLEGRPILEGVTSSSCQRATRSKSSSSMRCSNCGGCEYKKSEFVSESVINLSIIQAFFKKQRTVYAFLRLNELNEENRFCERTKIFATAARTFVIVVRIRE